MSFEKKILLEFLELKLIEKFYFSLPMNEECEKCCWALVFYLLQHYQSSLGESKEEMLNFILTALRNKSCSDSITSLLVRVSSQLVLLATKIC